MKRRRLCLFLLLLCSCAAGGNRTTIDVRSVPPENRIAISSVPFYYQEDQDLAVMPADERFAAIVTSTLERYLQEKGHAASFIGNHAGWLTEAEVNFLVTADSKRLVERRNTKFFAPKDGETPAFEQVGKILFPVVVEKKLPNALGRMLGNINLTFYAFLVDAKTGEVLWSGQKRLAGGYNEIDLELRGLRWGHGAMWSLLKTFK
ncbi:MAG TPA: hypothetical protein VGA73_03120 [Candidatus Binatia bacterium]